MVKEVGCLTYFIDFSRPLAVTIVQSPPFFHAVIVIVALILIAILVFLLKKASQNRELKQKLASEQERFESLVQTSNDWIWEIDTELRCTYSSPQVLDIMGYTPQEVIGRRSIEFMPADEAERIKDFAKHAIATRNSFRKIENRNITKDGRIIYVETNSVPLFDKEGKLIGFRGVNRDVTDRTLAEQSSEEYRRRTESLIGNLNGVAYRCLNSPQWPVEFISRGCIEMTGYEPMEFVNKRVFLNDLIHPDDRQNVWNQVQKALSERRRFDLEYRLSDKSGNVHWVFERGCGVWDQDNRLEALEGLIVDITDRVIAQQELQRSREFLESIIRSVPTGISVTVDRVLVSVNDRYCEIFGYSREELVGKSVRMLYASQEEYDRFGQKAYGEMRRTGTATDEIRCITKQGRQIEVLMRGAPLDPSEWSKGITFNVLDVTESNRVSRKLALRLKLERLVAEISAGFVNLPIEKIDDQINSSLQVLVREFDFERIRLTQIHPDTGKISLSRYFSAKQGLQTLLESDDLDKDLPELAELIRENRIIWWPQPLSNILDRKPQLKKLAQEKGIISFLCIPTTVGQEHVGSLLITHNQHPLEIDEDVFGYLRVIADIIANALVRKMTLRALADSERRFRSIVESSPMGILTYKLFPDGSLIFNGTNPAACKILAADICGLVGKPIEEVFGQLEPELIETYRQIAKNGGSYHGDSYNYHDNRISGVYDFEAFQTSAGRIAVMFSDITERRENELARERLMRQLRAKNDELESIVFIASHDLRSPLVNIRGFSGELEKSLQNLKAMLDDAPIEKSLKEKISHMFKNDFAEEIGFINSGSAKMETMLNGLLRLSRIGSVQSRPQRVNVNSLLPQIVRQFKYLIKEDEISLHISPNLPDCLGDPLLISQVFSNLIDNAIKYCSPDRKLVIKIEGTTEGSEAEYRIIDNGIGIAGEHIQRVFEIFHQLDPGKEGQGLGLTIVKKIVEGQEGSVRMESRPEHGTIVIIRLPRP